MNLLTSIISALAQVVLFTMLPLIFYFIKTSKFKGFFKYIGFTKPEKRTVFYALIIAFLYFGISYIVYRGMGILDTLKTMKLPGSVVHHLGFSIQAVFIILINSIIATAMSEEILFRGFLGKRFIRYMGFFYGNLLQSILFGLIHGILVWSILIDISKITSVILLTGTIAYVMGCLNEKWGNGSIIPGIITHSIANVCTILFFI